MLLKVGEFIVPIDFVICDMGVKDLNAPLILGRPFLATCRAIIDVGTGEITLRFNRNKANVKMATFVKEGVCTSREMVKLKTKTKPKWETDKLMWKNAWAPKGFRPKVDLNG